MKRYYEVRFGFYESDKKTVKASNLKEARKEAAKVIDKFKKQLMAKRIIPTVELSDRNFRLDVGAIYLLKRYSKQVPAECVYSEPRHRYYLKEDFCHTFKYLDSNKYSTIYSEGFNKPKRLIRKLCRGGEITDKCSACIARFNCFTNKKEE